MGVRYSVRFRGAAVAAALSAIVCGGCYARVPHPGLVRVIEYDRVDRVELELRDFRVRDDAERQLWVTADAWREGSTCGPILVTVATEDGALDDAVVFASAGEHFAATRTDAGWSFDASAFERWAATPPLAIHVGTARADLHDEHVFNIDGFVRELGCAAAELSASEEGEP